MDYIPFIDLHKRMQPCRDQIEAAIQRVLNSGVYAGGDEIRSFEAAWAGYLGLDHCIGIGNATDGFELLYRALGIGPGDEVIVPVCGLISPAEMATFCGATPVFADVDPVSYNVDPAKLEMLINPRTKAIICVHLYGQMAAVEHVKALCDKYGIFLIEDCAQAHGAGLKNGKAGSFGIAGIYSFYPTKNLGALGDAGAIVTRDEALADRLRQLANHGQSHKDRHVAEGRNSRLDPIQAAILSVRLFRLNRENTQRIAHATLYDALLRSLPAATPALVTDGSHVYHQYVIQTDDRDFLQEYLRVNGVQTAIHYPLPVPWQPAYESYASCRHHLPGAARSIGRLLSLPVGSEHSAVTIERVGELVRKAFKA